MEKQEEAKKPDMKRNFEYRAWANEDPDTALKELMKMGGNEEITIRCDGGLNSLGLNVKEHFQYHFSIINFPPHTIKAVVTREIFPEDSSQCVYLTRIRLGNYNTADHFTQELSQRLEKIE